MKCYPAYKDSGIEWIGQIPVDWDIRKLKYHFMFEKGKNAQVYTNEYVGANPGEYPVFSGQTEDEGVMGKIASFDYDTDEVLLATTVGAKAMTTRMISGKFSLSQNCALLMPREGISVQYHQFFIDRLFDFERGMISLIMQPSLRFEDLIRYRILMPSREEQDKIAEYLDHKTAQINDLIAKKERMIEILKEERTVIINQVVTKGFDPKAEMKDSGIEWLGKVPKHWEIKKLKFNALVQFSNVDKKSDETEIPVRLCNYVDVYYNDFITSDLDFMEATASPEEIKKFHLEIGDVLLTKDSEEWNDIAIPAYVTYEEPNMICGYHLAQVRPQEKLIIGKYLFWFLSADCINYQFRIEASGVTRYGLSNYALSNSLCLIPPKKEQEAIASFLDKKTEQIDAQVMREQKSIELLKEYRTSLISEVVTGKIDVRG